MDVKMFQMGFGESILLYDENSCLLVDCGSESKCCEDYFDNVIQELEKYEERSLLITHFHRDHINGVKYLCEAYSGCFSSVYVPNVFSSGDRALDLIIIQCLLEKTLNRRRKIYQIWHLLLDLVKAKLSICPFKRGDSFFAVGSNFQILWPKLKIDELNDIYKDIITMIPYCDEIEVTPLIENFREAAMSLASLDENIEGYTVLESRLQTLAQQFDDLQAKYIEIIKSKIGFKRFRQEIQSIYERLSSVNDTSIVFQTDEKEQVQILMTGDVETSTLKKIANGLFEPPVPVRDYYHIFKAPHHGTPTHYCNVFCYDRLLISNGETPCPNRGKISEAYLSGNRVRYVYCTNTIKRRCEYSERHNQCADACLSGAASGLQIQCAVMGTPKIIWNPINEADFKKALLKTKCAIITWEFSDRHIERTIWNAEGVTKSTNLRKNIQSRSQWRKKAINDLIKVYVEVV